MSRRLAPLFTLTALAATAPALLGCTEQPVIEVRWGFVENLEARDNGDTPTLNGVFECAQSGVSKVQLRVFTEDGSTFVGSRTHDCFPPSFSSDSKLAAGPIIDTPGTYRLDVVGLRGNDDPFERVVNPRSLLFGNDIPAPDPLPGYDCLEGEDTFIRFDSLGEGIGTEVRYGFQYCVLASWPPLADDSVDNRFTVDENGEVEWVDFDGAAEIPLVRPIPCDDGIDNDGDGAVDGADLACQVSLENPEDADEGFTVIRAIAGFFDSSFVTCNLVDATRLTLCLKDEGGEVVETFESTPCVDGDPTLQVGPLARVLDPGEYTLEAEIFGRSPATNNLEVVTKTQEAGPFIVPENAGGVFVHDFNFENTDWIDPFVWELNVSFNLQSSPGGEPRSCSHSGSTLLAIDTIEVEYADNPDGDAPFFEGEGTCGMGVVFPGGDVSWAEDKYYTTARAIADGTVCYEVTNRPLNPAVGEKGQAVQLRRLTDDDGSPIDGCEECLDDSDCTNFVANGSGATCNNGYCIEPSADGG